VTLHVPLCTILGFLFPSSFVAQSHCFVSCVAKWTSLLESLAESTNSRLAIGKSFFLESERSPKKVQRKVDAKVDAEHSCSLCLVRFRWLLFVLIAGRQAMIITEHGHWMASSLVAAQGERARPSRKPSDAVSSQPTGKAQPARQFPHTDTDTDRHTHRHTGRTEEACAIRAGRCGVVGGGCRG